MRGSEARAAYCEGRARLALGDAPAALPLLERAAAIRREDLSPASAQRLQAQAALSEAYRALDRRADAQHALDEARAVAARNAVLGPQYTQALERSERVVAAH
jgi:tetratricopeptide (TPR) repeat protein